MGNIDAIKEKGNTDTELWQELSVLHEEFKQRIAELEAGIRKAIVKAEVNGWLMLESELLALLGKESGDE